VWNIAVCCPVEANFTLREATDKRGVTSELTDFNRNTNQTGLDDGGMQRHIKSEGRPHEKRNRDLQPSFAGTTGFRRTAWPRCHYRDRTQQRTFESIGSFVG